MFAFHFFYVYTTSSSPQQPKPKPFPSKPAIDATTFTAHNLEVACCRVSTAYWTDLWLRRFTRRFDGEDSAVEAASFVDGYGKKWYNTCCPVARPMQNSGV